MKNRGAQRAIRAALGQTFVDVLQGADTSGGDHRNADGIYDRAREGEIVACACAIAIHARQEDLART